MIAAHAAAGTYLGGIFQNRFTDDVRVCEPRSNTAASAASLSPPSMSPGGVRRIITTAHGAAHGTSMAAAQ
jgi:hypothetical protein